MKLEELDSENQFSRYTSFTTTTQTPSYRIPNSRLPEQGLSQSIRRQHTAESVCCVQSGNGRDTDYEYNERSLPFRQRTNSTTSVETIRTRPTTDKLRNAATDAVVIQVAQNPAPRNSSATPTSSSINHEFKQKPFFQPTQSSALSLTTANTKGPQKKKISKGGSGPVPKPLPTIFNVGQSSLLSESVTLLSTASTTATTRSAFSFYEISLWDMETLPSILSLPDNSTPKNNPAMTASSNSYSASSGAPFSIPYDDDAVLGDEFPFPLNRHSNVIIENMGVKKAKNINKGRESLLNKHITTVGPDLHPHSGPTSSLALRSLRQNTAPLIPFARQTTSLTSSRSDTPTGPSSSRKDAWGCVHLGAADCELSIAFPKTSHYEAWDLGDDAFFSCPIFLCLMAKDPRIWTGTPISLPDVSLIDIRCDDLPVPSSMTVYDPTIEYAVQCIFPQKKAWDRASFSSFDRQKTPSPFVVDSKEITIDGRWERIYTKPKVEGRGQTQILHPGDATKNNNNRNGGAPDETTGRGWYLKIWIPIPARLFLKRETRIFEIRASVWMMGDEERMLSAMDLEGGEEDFPLEAEAEMTVSHLRSEREMMMMNMF